MTLNTSVSSQDMDTGPPLGKTRKVIHSRFSWRSNREFNETFFQNYLGRIEARNLSLFS